MDATGTEALRHNCRTVVDGYILATRFDAIGPFTTRRQRTSADDFGIAIDGLPVDGSKKIADRCDYSPELSITTEFP